MDAESEEVCWICLEDTKGPQGLRSPCKCPRKVHPQCMARWQLQQAGRTEETHCRFCNNPLADWKSFLTPEALKPEVERVQPIMVVYFEGEIHRIPVRQGDEGLKEFTSRIRELFKLPQEVDISLTFGCKEPMSGHHLKLEGMGAFDAAVHCASVAAAERQHKVGKRETKEGDRPDVVTESSDEGEDTTELLQSTLGGPIQRNFNNNQANPAGQGGNLAGGRNAATRHQPPRQATHRPVNGIHTARPPNYYANNPAQQRVAFPLNVPRERPAWAATPAGPPPMPDGRSNLNPAGRNTGIIEPPWLNTLLEDPEDPASLPTAGFPQQTLGPMDPRVHDLPHDLNPEPHHAAGAGNPEPSPMSSVGGLYAGSHGGEGAHLRPSGDVDADNLRRARRTSSRNQRAMQLMSDNNSPAAMECDDLVMHGPPAGAVHSGMDMAADTYMARAQTDVYRNMHGVTTGTTQMTGNPDGKRSGGLNYDVPPNVISRSKLNQVLSFFGIRPPAQYTLGSTVQMDD